MWIGVARIVLDFYNNEKTSIKSKHIDSLCKDIRKKFNVSALEVAEFDDPEKCVIGISAVMPEHWKQKAATAFMQTLLEFVDQTSFARVTIEDWDLLSHGGDA